jgi:hypothetical protein
MKIEINCCGGISPKCKCFKKRNEAKHHFISINSTNISEVIVQLLSEYLIKAGIPFSYQNTSDNYFIKIINDDNVYTLERNLTFGEYITSIYNHLYERKADNI